MRWSEAVLVAASTPVPAPHTPSSGRCSKGTALPPLKPRLQRWIVICSLVLPPPPPQSLPRAQEKGRFRRVLGTDDVAGPSLVLGARGQMRDDHLHSLQLLVLGGDGAHLIGDLVAFHGDVLPLHAAGQGDSTQRLAPSSRPHPGPQPAPSEHLPLLPCAASHCPANGRHGPVDSRAGRAGLGREREQGVGITGESHPGPRRAPEPRLRASLPSSFPDTQQACTKVPSVLNASSGGSPPCDPTLHGTQVTISPTLVRCPP